ncbi:hypothetical protein PsalMR5_00535 [Piscirickettsia salmonis]|uniref:hypothetical protein n=1 Tax=Piscirickettsia salmonis TaxID=1238 RepID=UPI0012BADEC2|nr:hypothetical protein [Piscirickettsia salmonis]QGP53129.1 hypothetical protein PsalSR1_00534 [Piscirickettsia salmonis]QGP60934.1 hypothetical protein PsalBI1_03557 [Piscirickettsia salmonis]QGP62698.1 hypothetical protein PsalMR5_00535 [Piscirickettsia salmonis]
MGVNSLLGVALHMTEGEMIRYYGFLSYRTRTIILPKIYDLVGQTIEAYNQVTRKRRYLGRYFAHPMMQNRRAKRDDYKPSAVRVTQRCVP